MNKSNSIIVRPLHSRMHGQTVRMNSVHHKLHIPIVPASKENLNEINKYKNLITFDTEDRDVYSIIKQFPDKRIISHFQFNPSYLGTNSTIWKLNCKTLELSDHVIVPASFLKVKLREFINTPITVVPNGVDPDIFQIQKSAKKQLHIGHVGRLIDSKGLQILSDLWQNLPSSIIFQIECADIKFPLKTNNRITSNASLSRNNHVTPALDYLISTSLSEVAPLVIIEALLSGVPVIATDSTPYIDELVQNFGPGVVKKIEIPNRLKHIAMEDLRLDSQESDKISKDFIEAINRLAKPDYSTKRKIRNKALEMGFSDSIMCEKFEEIYLKKSS